jgi:hypothetical protein
MLFQKTPDFDMMIVAGLAEAGKAAAIGSGYS